MSDTKVVRFDTLLQMCNIPKELRATTKRLIRENQTLYKVTINRVNITLPASEYKGYRMLLLMLTTNTLSNCLNGSNEDVVFLRDIKYYLAGTVLED